jgi:hypothetical protein
MRIVNESSAPVETEEQARRRVWERVRLGIAADRRRRMRRASLALLCGAALSLLGFLILMVV